MRILFLGLNYAPEQIGIAVYSTGLCEKLAAMGHEVRAIVAKPYYPEWRVRQAFRGGGVRTSRENGVWLRRLPLYVPVDPTGIKRIFHHLSFALSALVPTLREAWKSKPDVVVTVVPSLIAAPVAWLAASLTGARTWLHIQDFEVEASFATGLVARNGVIARSARRFERFVLRRFDRVSSISLEMCRKARSVIGSGNEIVEFRNWAKIDEIKPLDRPSIYRQRWGITTPHVALYSGNIANKQGIEIVVDAARHLARRRDLTFVVCGEGPNRAALQQRADGLGNICFYDLQPADQLNELMGLATVHLLPQKPGAADLVLPSKLTNMLASGRPVVATAAPGTGLAREVEGCGAVVPPTNHVALAEAIERLIDRPHEWQRFASTARARAEEAWDPIRIVSTFAKELENMAAECRSNRPRAPVDG